MTTDPISNLVGAAEGGPVAVTVDSVLALLTSLAQLGATPAVQQAVLTWLKERAGASEDVIAEARKKWHMEPSPTHPKKE